MKISIVSAVIGIGFGFFAFASEANANTVIFRQSGGSTISETNLNLTKWGRSELDAEISGSVTEILPGNFVDGVQTTPSVNKETTFNEEFFSTEGFDAQGTIESLTTETFTQFELKNNPI